MKFRLTVFLLGGLLICGQSQFAVSLSPKWELPEFPRRAVVALPKYAESCVLVTLPGEKMLEDKSGLAAFDSAGTPLPCRVIFADATAIHILVDIKAGEKTGRVRLYYGAAATAAGARPQSSFQDPLPLFAEIHRPAGQSLPDSWDKMFWLYAVSGAAVGVSGHPGFGDLDLFLERKEPKARKHATNLWLSRIRTQLLCPETGNYRIGLECSYAGYLLVDGDVVAGRISQIRPEPWGNPQPLKLAKGLHQLEIFAFSEADLALRVGWSLPGQEAITPLPAEMLISAFEAQDSRVECIDRTMHGDFRYSLLPAYRFRHKAPVYTPVVFRNQTANWVSETMKCQWDFGDGTQSEEENPVHLFSRAGLWKVKLAVKDNLGFVGQCERLIDGRLRQAREYDFDVRILYLPAVCYESDVIEPILELNGRIPDNAGLDLSWKIVKNTGQITQDRKEVKLAGAGVRVPLEKIEAGKVNRIEWQIMHGGIVLDSGRVRFLAPPFSELPVRIEGDRLLNARGEQLVLIPVRNAGRIRQQAITPEMALGPIFCLDDSLALPGLSGGNGTAGYDRSLARLLGRPDSPDIRWLDLASPADSFRDAYAPLVKLARVPQMLTWNAGIAVVTIGLEDVLSLVPPAQFERNAGALCDLLYATLHCPVVLATLPPYPPDPERIKPYAAAIRKVADARGIPVADLYTGFLGMSEAGQRSFFRNHGLGLSESGQHLAAQLIIRALLGASKENRP